MTRTQWVVLAASLLLIAPLTWAGDVYYPGSRFTFFDNVRSVPAPRSLMLFGTALLGFSVLLRRLKGVGR